MKLKCDKCGSKLYQREDQKEEIVKNRLEIYSKTAKDLIKYYKDLGIFYNAKSGNKVGKTSHDVAKEVEEYISKINNK